MKPKRTTEEFIKIAKQMHGDLYDYSKVEYMNSSTKVCIICPEHGEFWQTPANHLHKTNKRGCPKCNGGIKLSHEEFIKLAQQIHGDKYDYTQVKYKNSQTKVCIICPDHGPFWQRPASHLRGAKCQECCSNRPLNKEKFVELANQIHNNRYDYSLTEYVRAADKVKIICHTTYADGTEHGVFEQTANSHLAGHGCPYCTTSTLEKELIEFFHQNEIKYVPQKKFNWLKNKRFMTLDFYLPQYMLGIECQGIQHYKPVDMFGGVEAYNKLLLNDKLKRETVFKTWCFTYLLFSCKRTISVLCL